MNVFKNLFSGDNKKRIIIVSLVAIAIVFASGYASYQYQVEQERIEQERIAEEKRKAKEREEKKLTELRKEHAIEGITSILSEKYANVITEDEKVLILSYEEDMMTTHKVKDFEKYKGELDELVANLDTRLSEWEAEQQRIAEEEARKAAEAAAAQEAEAQQQSQQPVSNGSGLTASSGVNHFGGRKETYYSSNVLYHHRTPEWWVDGEGFYRTAEGYYVVAASDMAQGTVFQGSKGACQVLDSGCAAGVTDYYVNW